MAKHRKLAFYSDQHAGISDAMNARLMGLIGRTRPRIGYVASEPDPEREYYQRTREHYAQLGAVVDGYLDAEQVSDAARVAKLLTCDAIHLSGGNTFTFITWLKRCDLARWLTDYACRGGVLIGVSAGAVIMTPSVLSAELCGDVRPQGVTDDTGLGLVDFHFWPHYQSQLREGDRHPQQLPSLRDLFACPDGSGIIVDGLGVELFGQVQQVRTSVPLPASVGEADALKSL
jgi:dipeptidase E